MIHGQQFSLVSQQTSQFFQDLLPVPFDHVPQEKSHPSISWKAVCIAKGDNLLGGDSSLAEVIIKYLGQVELFMYSSLSESEFELCLFHIFSL